MANFHWVTLLCSLAVVLQTVYGQDLRWLVLQIERLKEAELLNTEFESPQKEGSFSQLEEASEYLSEFWGDWPNLIPYLSLSEECVISLTSLATNSSLPLTLLKLLPFLDASGKPGAGLLNGNFILDGAYDECFSYNYTAFCYATFVYLAKKPSYPPWTLGLCVPKHCGSKDLSNIINLNNILKVSEKTVYCDDVKEAPYSTGAIVMIVVCLLFVGMVIIGTTVDGILMYACLDRREDTSVNASLRGDGENTPLLMKPTSHRNDGHVRPWEFITAFSLVKTVPTLLATKQAPSVISCLNGLRVISMFWVILCHAYIWMLLSPGHVDNPIVMKSVLSRFSFQAIGNGFFSVDTFFFLSGVLVAYLSLREMEKKRGRFPFLHYYVHRYLRLTPVYAFVLFFTMTLYVHLADGPGFIGGGQIQSTGCQKFWWSNLLYINNFYPWQSINGSCIGWTWYLANDMQFYVISPLILLPMYFLFPVALVIVIALLFVSVIVTGVLTGVYNYQANFFSAVAYNYTMSLSGPQYFDLVYSKPWSRIQPYLVGLLLGFVLYKKFHFRFRRRVNFCLYVAAWVLAAVIMIPDLYGLYFTYHGHVPTKAENVIFMGVSKFAWGLGLALIVYACHSGYGWFVNSFLSMKIWTPLARMTYNAYLIHPVVLSVVYGQLQKSFHYTDITVAVFTVSFVVISYGLASVLCLVVEFPLATIEMLVFKLVGVKGRESQRQDTYDLTKKDGSGPTPDLFTKTIA